MRQRRANCASLGALIVLYTHLSFAGGLNPTVNLLSTFLSRPPTQGQSLSTLTVAQKLDKMQLSLPCFTRRLSPKLYTLSCKSRQNDNTAFCFIDSPVALKLDQAPQN